MSDTASFVIMVVVVLAVAVLGYLAWLVHAARAPLAVRTRVMVNLTDGSAVEGLLWRRAGSHLVLRDVLVHEAGQSVAADGELVVAAPQVRYVQVLR